MKGDIWEIDDEMPSFGTVDQPFISVTSEAPYIVDEINPWTLLIIILAIWLLVRNR